jgi:tetratricopeptide (TPR) repeat protein
MQLATYLWEKCLGEIDTTRARYLDEAQYEGLSEDEATRAREVNAHRVDRLEKLLSDVQNELAIAAWNDGSADRAQSLFLSAVSNNPSNALARVNLGVIYLDYANFADACAQFAEGLALRPRNEEALVGMGACTYGLNDIDGAYAAFERAQAQYPTNDFVLRRLGEIAYQDRNDIPAAIGWYTELLNERDMAEATCPDTDRDCSTLRALRQMEQSAVPRQPE